MVNLLILLENLLLFARKMAISKNFILISQMIK
uniref:Uncharacterized protein n=1 Tax=Siphoviridae sp. ctB3v5 TaxID=2826186 RepID=A0A8S5M8W7_9CAUD|nr:MAG TPA: hypothetical protein [Siphoviridae sp. ctB3v5]